MTGLVCGLQISSLELMFCIKANPIFNFLMKREKERKKMNASSITELPG